LPAETDVAAFAVETIHVDLPGLAAKLNRRLYEAGLPTTAERSVSFANALKLVNPITRRRLYWTARAVFVSDKAQVNTFEAVFFGVFGSGTAEPRGNLEAACSSPAPLDERPRRDREHTPADSDLVDRLSDGAPSSASEHDSGREPGEVLYPTAPSDEELLREKRFDTLQPDELAQLYCLMRRLELATPERRTRRTQRYRHGSEIDMRRTLRVSMRTGGDPFALARRRRRVVRRRIVLLCDISGSMEPYARAYLQFLTCAAGSGPGAEAFVFATRLTRLTRALTSRNPERAIQQAAAIAPDWSSGTRIGDALKAFNDRHGRRGLARGAVIVILSDGWERGDPELVGREMQRLARLAYRIVWVNPRAAAREFVPRAGGMMAALPHCDALLSGHSLAALSDVAEAIAAENNAGPRPSERWNADLSGSRSEADEQWASATPVRGSSVAMPSGYGPGRGRTTPGWGLPEA
jgi:uncharacterized protein with von Willebrand factor type A (vWA) domain